MKNENDVKIRVVQAMFSFIGGVLASSAVYKLSNKRSAGKRRTDRRLQKQESSKPDSAGPPTPVTREPKQYGTFERDTKDIKIKDSVSSYPDFSMNQREARGFDLRPRTPFGNSDASSTESVSSISAEQRIVCALARATSGIPTDIHLPTLVFGDQVADGNSHQELPVLPFPDYAACRLLDVKPHSEVRGHIFNGIQTIAGFYLRADSASICQCIQNFGIYDLLFSIAKLEIAFKSKLRSNLSAEVRASTSISPGVNAAKGCGVSWLAGKLELGNSIAEAAEQVLGQSGQTLVLEGAEEAEAVRGVVSALMHELECILHEYLSFNWDRAEEIYDSNKHLLREEGLLCGRWKPPAHGLSLPSTPSLAGKSPRQWDNDSTLSGSHGGSTSDLADLDQASSPGSDRSRSAFENFESFDEYLAKRNILGGSAHGSAASGTRQELTGREGSLENGTERANSSGRCNTDSRSATAKEATGHRRQSSADAGTSGRPLPKASRAEHQSSTSSATYRRAVKNWKRAKAAVTRKVTREMLGPKRRFLTLQQMFLDMNKTSDSQMLPERQPIILLLGGGMAAGKSTVREIIGRDGFWSKVGKDAVIVEADAIKFRDVYKSVLSLDALEKDGVLRKHLHEYSTKAAEIILAAAVNQQKDVVFDGTMTWAPFVEQTIAMVRDHQHNYRRGPGISVEADGSITERYWEVDLESTADVANKKPYRIELVGVTCDTGLAVARGIWRKIRTGRSVPVASQLRSHRLFAGNFENFASLVDSATLYHTGSALTTFNKGGVDLSPKVIAHRSSYTRGELLINSKAYKSFQQKVNIVDEATCRRDLYGSAEPCDGKVPTTQDDQMSTLRHVFRAADRRERRAQRRRPTPFANSTF